MPWLTRRNEQVVSETARHSAKLQDAIDPRVKNIEYQNHAERASLRNTAWVEVRFPAATSNGVEIAASLAKGVVSKQRSRREAPDATSIFRAMLQCLAYIRHANIMNDTDVQRNLS